MTGRNRFLSFFGVALTARKEIYIIKLGPRFLLSVPGFSKNYCRCLKATLTLGRNVIQPDNRKRERMLEEGGLAGYFKKSGLAVSLFSHYVQTWF